VVRVHPGIVVFVRFPFSDLSSSKRRPAIVTSNPYGDRAAVALNATSFESGGLGRESFARPGKLFTANQSLAVSVAGTLTATAHRELIDRVVAVLRM